VGVGFVLVPGVGRRGPMHPVRLGVCCPWGPELLRTSPSQSVVLKLPCWGELASVFALWGRVLASMLP
jgi:hypothetical protein